MNTNKRHLTVEQAVSEFFGRIERIVGSGPARPPLPPEQREALYFRAAESLLASLCAGTAQCGDQRCRRGGLCRLVAGYHAAQADPTLMHPRRTPGTSALRYAIWVYQSARGR